MEFKKKTIIWEDNNEPPKDYIWVKSDGKAYEFDYKHRVWKESTIGGLIGGNCSLDKMFSDGQLVLSTLPELDETGYPVLKFPLRTNLDHVYELAAKFNEGTIPHPVAEWEEEKLCEWYEDENGGYYDCFGLEPKVNVVMRTTLVRYDEEVNDYVWDNDWGYVFGRFEADALDQPAINGKLYVCDLENVELTAGKKLWDASRLTLAISTSRLEETGEWRVDLEECRPDFGQWVDSRLEYFLGDDVKHVLYMLDDLRRIFDADSDRLDDEYVKFEFSFQKADGSWTPFVNTKQDLRQAMSEFCHTWFPS